MKMGHERVLVSQEPLYTCRLCGNAGHTIFQCTESRTKSLEDEEVTGFTEEPEETEDVDMEEHEEMDEQAEVDDEEHMGGFPIVLVPTVAG